MSTDYELCESLQKDKRVVCENIVDNHAKLQTSTKEAEKQLSELTGQDIVMIQSPDALTPVGDKDVLEAWTAALCASWKPDSDEKVKDTCQDSIAKWIKNEKDFGIMLKDIKNLTGVNEDKVEADIVTTCPCGAGRS